MESETERMVRHASPMKAEAIRMRRDAQLSIQRCHALQERIVEQRVMEPDGLGPSGAEQIESDLMERLRLSQSEWTKASEENRDLARQRFMNALHTFNSLVLCGKLPKEH